MKQEFGDRIENVVSNPDSNIKDFEEKCKEINEKMNREIVLLNINKNFDKIKFQKD